MKEIIYLNQKFIRGDICGFGVPDFPEYINTLPTDWYWLIDSKKDGNHFIWKDSIITNSKLWK